jgi:hypothetical protein
LRFLLHDDRAGSNPTAPYDIVDAEPDQIASAQLAVDSEISVSMIQLKSNPDGPDFFQLQWRFLAE